MATGNSLYIKGNAVTLGSLFWRAFLLIDAIVLTAAAFAACYQVVRTRQDRLEFPPPGRLVAVGNFRLHIDCVGERPPTVVVVPGTGVWSAQWSLIQRDLAKDARVCTYDRAGFGWSDSANSPQTALQAALELHELLASASESSPYLLVGESYGGYVVRLFHEKYPHQVAGIVLVESAHERQWKEIPQAKSLLEQAAPKLKTAVLLSRLAFFRWKVSDSGADLPEGVRASFRAAQAHTETFQAILAELDGVFASTQQVSETHRLGSLPLVVVSAGCSFNKFVTADKEPQLDQMNRKWLQLQQELAGLSDNSVHLVSPKATHGIAREQPDLVAKAIRQTLQLARSHQK